MKLDLERFDEFVKSNGDEAPVILWQDASTFDPANLPSDEPRPSGAPSGGLPDGGLSNSSDDADVVGK